MKSVKVSTVKLLGILRDNREMHVTEFESAMLEYRKEAIVAMKANLKIAEQGGEIETFVGLTRPASYESSYTTAIKMLELSEDSTVELTAQEFQQYVEDNWVWKQAFLAGTSIYNSKSA